MLQEIDIMQNTFLTSSLQHYCSQPTEISIHCNLLCWYLRRLYRKSRATFFCMQTGKSRRRRVCW